MKVKTKIKARRNSTACRKEPVVCKDGPMEGEKLWLQYGTTAYFTYRGETGRYVFGKWEAVA